MNPLVTVVTPTWRRPKLLTERCIPSVQAQTYRPFEHLIINDGPADPELRARLFELGYTPHGQAGRRFVELGRHWGGVGHYPRAAGAWLAAGEWVCYLDDDNTYEPSHIEVMVAEAERTGVQLVCTAWRNTQTGRVEGASPPGLNRTDSSSFLHRADLLRVMPWHPGDGYAADGVLIERWLQASVRWSFLPEPTMVYTGAHGGVPE